MCSDTPPKLSDWLTNMDQDMPLGRKLRLLGRNIWIRIVKRQNCCGHNGEPGC